MKIRLCKIDFLFSFWFFAVVLTALSLGRSVLALYFLIPVFIHELGHIAAMLICGVKIRQVRFCAFGIDIERDSAAATSYTVDFIISIAGAAANLICSAVLYLFFFQSMRTMLFTSVNIALAVFNLLPVGTLDGGQALGVLLRRWGKVHTWEAISRICSFAVLVPLFACSGILVIRGVANISLLIVCFYLVGNVIHSS